jgi:hypothetical protein
VKYEQGAHDSLYAAKRALDRAIALHEGCKGEENLSLDSGLLFAVLDNLDTVVDEVANVASIYGTGIGSHLSWAPHDGSGDIMTKEHFEAAVAAGGFIDYDGYGYLLKFVKPGAYHVLKGKVVKPSDLDEPYDWKGATHVAWYNR